MDRASHVADSAAGMSDSHARPAAGEEAATDQTDTPAPTAGVPPGGGAQSEAKPTGAQAASEKSSVSRACSKAHRAGMLACMRVRVHACTLSCLCACFVASMAGLSQGRAQRRRRAAAMAKKTTATRTTPMCAGHASSERTPRTHAAAVGPAHGCGSTAATPPTATGTRSPICRHAEAPSCTSRGRLASAGGRANGGSPPT